MIDEDKACVSKRRFGTKEEVVKFLASPRTLSGQSSYKCVICDGWHMTTKSTHRMPRNNKLVTKGVVPASDPWQSGHTDDAVEIPELVAGTFSLGSILNELENQDDK